MMKSVMIAAVAVLGMATVASAGERLPLIGYSEYAVEAQTFELGVGTEFVVADKLVIAPAIVGFGPSDDFNFDRLEVKASYGLNDKVDLYGKVETDADLHYAETTVGVAFRF